MERYFKWCLPVQENKLMNCIKTQCSINPVPGSLFRTVAQVLTYSSVLGLDPSPLGRWCVWLICITSHFLCVCQYTLSICPLWAQFAADHRSVAAHLVCLPTHELFEGSLYMWCFFTSEFFSMWFLKTWSTCSWNNHLIKKLKLMT